MLNNSNTFFFVALLCLLGCNSADKGDSNQADFKYKIMVENVEENVSFDDIVQDYKYVKLETGSSSLLGEIKKIIVVDEKIYVLSQGLFCFDINGKFLFAINKMGRGPSEFIRINDFAIDGDKLFLYDNILSKLICFNKETGTYLKDWKLIYSVKELQVINGSLILNRGNIPNDAVKKNNSIMVCKIEKQDSVRSYLPFENFNMVTEQQLYGFNKQAYWVDQIFNQVFKISENQVQKHIWYDFGKHNVTVDEASKRPSLGVFRKKNKAFYLQDVFENSDFIFSNLSFGEDHLWVIYNKPSAIVKAYNKMNCAPYQISPGSDYVYGEYFCKLISNLEINFSRIKMEKQKYSLMKNNKDYNNYALIKESKTQDNPMIGFYRLKKTLRKLKGRTPSAL